MGDGVWGEASCGLEGGGVGLVRLVERRGRRMGWGGAGRGVLRGVCLEG